MKKKTLIQHALTLQQQVFKRLPLVFIRLAIILGIVILLSGATPATVEESKADKKAEPVELHNLNNEQLLKQAQQIFDEASVKFMAQLRGLYRMNQLFKQAQQ